MSSTLKKRQLYHINIRKSLKEEKFNQQRKKLIQHLHKQNCLYQLQQIFNFTSFPQCSQLPLDKSQLIQQKCYDILEVLQKHKDNVGVKRQILRFLCFHLGVLFDHMQNTTFGKCFLSIAMLIFNHQHLTYYDKINFIQAMDQQKLFKAFLKSFYQNGLQSDYQLTEFFFTVCSYRNIFYATSIQDARLDILIQQLIYYIKVISLSEMDMYDYKQQIDKQLLSDYPSPNNGLLRAHQQPIFLLKILNCLQFLCYFVLLLPNHKQKKLCKTNVSQIKQFINLIYKKIFINKSQQQYKERSTFVIVMLVRLVQEHVELEEKIVVNQCLLKVQYGSLLVDQIKLQLFFKLSTKYDCLNQAKIIKWLNYQIHKPVQQSIINLSRPKSISILFQLIRNMNKRADQPTKRQISNLFNQRQLMQLIMGQKRSHYAQSLGELLNILAFSNNQSSQYQMKDYQSQCQDDQQYQFGIDDPIQKNKYSSYSKLCYQQIIWQFLKFNYKFLTYKLKERILFKFILRDQINIQECDQFFTQEEIQRFQNFFQIQESYDDYIYQADEQYQHDDNYQREDHYQEDDIYYYQGQDDQTQQFQYSY